MTRGRAGPPPGAGAVAQAARTAAKEPERLAVGFTAALRRAGLAVPTGATVRYAEALAAVGLGREGPVYWAGRATLVHRAEDAATYDEVFGAYWLRRSGVLTLPVPAPGAPEVAEEASDDGGDGRRDDDEGAEGPVLELRYSAVEVLRERDFAACTPAELDEAHRAIAAMRLQGPRRATRRRRRNRSRGDWPDLRRTVREALRTGGEPLERRWLEAGERPRRIVFLCDVSGSMAPYARALLRFAHAAVVARRSTEVFTIGTRLTRVSRALSVHDPDAALAGVAALVPDWSGGTRLGEALAGFNDRWGVRGLARGAVVVVLSDGWDRGDPGLLGREMARLGRVAARVIWVNPLKATPGYAPLVRGMAAALPYVDEFVEGHSLASLEALAATVAGGAPPGRAGRAMGGSRTG